ncbi:MAG: YceI family protein [Ekhidna sp.]|nr:YceI family protein [Ekhidna sp.]
MLFSLLFFLLLCINQSSDVSNAYVSFEVSHLAVLVVKGSFSEINGELRKEKDMWLAEGEIMVDSLDTGNTTRDRTILTAPYLNADEYPTIPFEVRMKISSDVVSVQIGGQIRGLPFEIESQLVAVDDRLVSLPITLDRKAIGLDFGTMDSLIGNEITLVIHTGLKPDMLD